eukprot:14034712-Alexandrium_andersonii.AAC.1
MGRMKLVPTSIDRRVSLRRYRSTSRLLREAGTSQALRPATRMDRARAGCPRVLTLSLIHI